MATSYTSTCGPTSPGPKSSNLAQEGLVMAFNNFKLQPRLAGQFHFGI
jgi:hypothetical protein